MITGVFRVVYGFLAACLIAAAVQVAYAVTPAEYATNPAGTFELVLLTATHFAVFSAPFAFVMAAMAEWQGIRGWIFYALVGIAVALAGFVAQVSSETGSTTILNAYAMRAFLIPGFIGGFVYWLVAGRRAGGARTEPAETPPADPKVTGALVSQKKA